MNIADLGTLLKIYDDLSFGAQKHLVGHLLQCTPETVKIIRSQHGPSDQAALQEFFEKMHELGIYPPTVVPTTKLPEVE